MGNAMKMLRYGSLRMVLAVITIGVVLGTFGPAQNATAGPGLLLYTSYPGITAKPGDLVSFSLNVKNTSGYPRMVDLKIDVSPKGWEEARFKGVGRQVHQVYVLSDESGYVTFEVKVPSEVKPGVYSFVISGISGSTKTSLPLEIRIDPKAPSATRFIVDYPVLRGPAGAEYEFRLTLANDSMDDQMYSLSAEAAPGWEVSFRPSYQDKQIASISVKGGSTEGISVRVRPPAGVKAGTYPIRVTATGARTSAETELKVAIIGTYKVELTTPTGRLNINAVAGRERPFTLLVENEGTADLHNLSLSSMSPGNWSVTFDPDRIDLLPAGQSQEVKAKIKPDHRAIAGDYVTSVSVSSPEVRDTVDFRVTVETSTAWGLAGVGIVAAVLAGLVGVFRRYGRR